MKCRFTQCHQEGISCRTEITKVVTSSHFFWMNLAGKVLNILFYHLGHLYVSDIYLGVVRLVIVVLCQFSVLWYLHINSLFDLMNLMRDITKRMSKCSQKKTLTMRMNIYLLSSLKSLNGALHISSEGKISIKKPSTVHILVMVNLVSSFACHLASASVVKTSHSEEIMLFT